MKIAIATLLSVSAVLLLGYSCSRLERPEKFYPTSKEVEADNAIGRGWIPPNLPASASNIHEKHDLDLNVGVVAFEASANEIKHIASSLVELLLEQIDSDRRVPGLARSVSWWPAELRRLRPNEELTRKYRFFRTTNQSGEVWYFAVDRERQRCFAWVLVVPVAF